MIVNTYSVRDLDKRARARAVLDRVVSGGRGALSTQVLGEVFRVLTARLEPALSAAEGMAQLANLVRTWPVLSITPPIVLEAARGVRDHQLSYWDAQLWATARMNQVPTILTEDAAHGRVLEGIRYLNPFDRAFDLGALD